VLDEYFAAGDDRFLPALRAFHEPKKLAAIADRWKKDPRPWARVQTFDYLDQPVNVPGHETVVKRLFKWAEERGDDELMSAFAVAFDRLVRRQIKTKHRYDFQTRQVWQEEKLVSPRNVMPHVDKGTRVVQNPKTLERIIVGYRMPKDARLFSYHTRHYLRRRAWRYFRRKGFKQPNDYCAAVARMLRRHTDGFLGTGASLLDSWSLVHACFAESDVIEFTPSSAKLAPGRGLSELTAAPDFPELWKKPEATRVLVSLLTTARSRPVRVWAIQLLRRDHLDHFAVFTPQEILPLLDHEDEQVQQLAAEILERLPNLDKLELATWFKLLETHNPAALEIISRLMQQHVSPDRLTLEQMVDIANAQPVPVARLGLSFLRNRAISTDADRRTIARLSQARAAGVAAEITAYALWILGSPEHYNADNVSRFFDSLLQRAREAAWAWLSAPQSPGRNDPALWSRLIETPYDDVRFHVVGELQRREKLPGTSIDQITLVWTSVLLGIHRGGRAKLAALKQISGAIQDDPARAERLLPVLAVAIRSVRLPEVRTGLSAVVAAVDAHPPLAPAVEKYLPELRLDAEVVA
jgi:hypothetical protein